MATRKQPEDVAEDIDPAAVEVWRAFFQTEKTSIKEALGHFLIDVDPDPDGDDPEVPYELFTLRPRQAETLSMIEEIWRLKRRAARIICLKSRRYGMSTFYFLLGLERILRVPGYRVLLIAQDDVMARTHFQRLRATFCQIPRWILKERGIEVVKDTDNQIILRHEGYKESEFRVAPAKRNALGRGDRYNFLILTEFPMWPPSAKADLSGVLAACRNVPGNIIVFESTAKGYDAFHRRYMRAKKHRSDYRAQFVAAFEHPGNRKRFATPEAEDEFIKTIGTLPEFGVEDELVLFRRLTVDFEWAPHDAAEHLNWRRTEITDNCEGNTDFYHRENPNCVVGETLISTERGILPIAEAQGVTQTESGAVVAWGPQPLSDIYRLTTQDGRVLRGTADHPIHTPLGFRNLADLVPGQTITLRPPMLRPGDEYERVTWPILGGAHGVVTINERWALLLGFFMGDGCWHSNTLTISCAAVDPDVVAVVDDLVRELVAPPAQRTIARVKGRKGVVEVRVHRLAAQDAFWALGALKPKGEGTPRERGVNRRVCVPPAIFRSPRPIVREFLRGLFESDGCAGAQSIGFSSNKITFIRHVQHLLLAFGVTCTIHTRTRLAGNGKRYEWHELMFTRNESDAYMKAIGFVSERKNARDYGNRSHIGQPRVPLAMADVVRSVEPDGVDVTYNITVTPDHVFSANGILTHNTDTEAFQGTGLPLFRKELLEAWRDLAEAREAAGEAGRLSVLSSSRIEFMPDLRGPLKVFERPQAGRIYAFGADVSSGIAKNADGKRESDYSVTIVKDVLTKVTVARLRLHMPPGEYAREVFRLACWYNGARGYIERSINDAGVCIDRFEDEEWGEYAGMSLLLSQKRLVKSDFVNVRANVKWTPGFQTTKKTKPALVEKIGDLVRDTGLPDEVKACPWDLVTLDELGRFERDDRTGSMEAAEGHDDAVMAEGMALEAIERIIEDGIETGAKVEITAPKTGDEILAFYCKVVNGHREEEQAPVNEVEGLPDF